MVNHKWSKLKGKTHEEAFAILNKKIDDALNWEMPISEILENVVKEMKDIQQALHDVKDQEAP